MLVFRLIVLSCLAVATAAVADEAAEVQKLIRQGDLPAALRRAERAGSAQPLDAPVRFQQGVVLMDLHRDADALAVFQRLSEDFPDLADPFNNIGLLYARAGRLEPARAALEQALRNDPAHAVARANLGEIYLRLAIQSWEAAASAVPGDKGLQRRLQLARELTQAPR